MKAPSRLDLLAFDARHDAHQLNIGAGGSPRRAIPPGCSRVGCRICSDGRLLPFENSDEGRNDCADAESSCGDYTWVAWSSDCTGDAITEVTVHVVFGRTVFCDEKPVALIGLSAFGHGRSDRQYDFRLVAPGSKGRFEGFLELVNDHVGQVVHELRLLFKRDVQHRYAVGQVEHDAQEFEVNGPLILAFEFQGLFRSRPLDDGDRLSCHREHEFRHGLHLVSERRKSGRHKSPLLVRHYIQLNLKVQVLISANVIQPGDHARCLCKVSGGMLYSPTASVMYLTAQSDANMDREVKPYILKRTPDQDLIRKFSLDYAKELNAQQYAAVTAAEGPALVIAGAGSGKTRTLVHRVAYLIDSGVDPSHILLLTFTRKSSEEMLERVGALIGSRSQRVCGGTFHSVANMLLRRHGRVLGVEPGFTIMDRGDAEDLIALLRAQLGLNEKDKRFPRKGTIAEIYSKCENTLRGLEEIVLDEFSHFADHLEALGKLQRAYQAAKRQRQLLDYDDLLVLLRDLLVKDEPTRRAISQQFRYILVDEYQDTNRLQAELIRKLAATHENVMVVGDDSQSIYAFRGATFRNIMEFPSWFPGAKIYKLEENYRSTQPILSLANEIIQEAPEKYTKHLFTRKLDGPLPALVEAAGENAQSRFVAQKILELREEGIPLSEIAVLFRSSFHSFDLEIELSRCGLPFVKRGGIKFIEAAHVKDLLAHLRVVVNPQDAVSWHRVLMLVEGVGPKKAQDLVAAMVRVNDPYQVLRDSSGRSGKGLKELGVVLDNLSKSDDLSPTEQVNRIYEYYLPILKDHHDDYPKRIRDLDHLHTIAESYPGLTEFLADLALAPPDGSAVGVEPSGREDEQVVLSTIHSAKGLEWQCVFLLWVVDGKFPSVFSFNTDEELEEERRLLYVAVTRAKRYLFLTYPINVYDRSSGMLLSKPSRFLDHVSPRLFETLALVEESHGHEWGHEHDRYV